MPGLQAGRGRLVVYTSAGNNCESSVLASQFAKALGEDVNRTLNERRWSLVLSASAGSQQNVDRLRLGLARTVCCRPCAIAGLSPCTGRATVGFMACAAANLRCWNWGTVCWSPARVPMCQHCSVCDRMVKAFPAPAFAMSESQILLEILRQVGG